MPSTDRIGSHLSGRLICAARGDFYGAGAQQRYSWGIAPSSYVNAPAAHKNEDSGAMLGPRGEAQAGSRNETLINPCFRLFYASPEQIPAKAAGRTDGAQSAPNLRANAAYDSVLRAGTARDTPRRQPPLSGRYGAG